MILERVIKRDGSLVPYERVKIFNAITGANNASTEQMSSKEIESVTHAVECDIQNCVEISVEDIQDVVERHLMQSGFFEVAKKYICYRYKHMLRRESKKNLMQTYKDILFTNASEVDDKRENANINADGPMGMMLKIGSDSAKEFALNMQPKEFAEAHRKHFIHEHDNDFSLITLNCCQIDLLKLFHGGFSTGHGHIREPGSIRSYAALACVAVQSSQNDMFGGQSINAVDYAMAEGIRKSFIKEIIKKIIEIGRFCVDDNYREDIVRNQVNEKIDVSKIHYVESIGRYKPLGTPEVDKYWETIREIWKIFCEVFMEVEKNEWDGLHIIYKLAKEAVEEETHQAMEAMVYNFNTCHSRNGGQVPFSSINFGMDTSPEGRLATKEILNAIYAGLGKGETPLFPINIFQIKSGINYNPGDPNYDLFERACEVSAKRLYPNFVSCDASFNIKYYKPGNYNTYAATMGCADGCEVIMYILNGSFYCESLKRMWNRVNEPIRTHGKSTFIKPSNMMVYDGNNGFVRVKTLIKNPDMGNWIRVKFSNGRSILVTSDHPLYTSNRGRVFVKDLEIGDYVGTRFDFPEITQNGSSFDSELGYILGLIIADGNYSKNLTVTFDTRTEQDIIKKFCDYVEKSWKTSCYIYDYKRGIKGNYTMVYVHGNQSTVCNYLKNIFGGDKKIERSIPHEIFCSPRDVRLAFMAGMIDADGHISHKSKVQIGSVNKELALQQLALAQSLGWAAKMYLNKYSSSNSDKIRYRIEFTMTKEITKFLGSHKKSDVQWNGIESATKTPNDVKVVEITNLGNLGKNSYDLETESDSFTLSFINSGNCRTRVIGNVNGPEETGGRGNFSFVTLNLPKFALEAKRQLGNKTSQDELIRRFYEIYDHYIQLSHDYLLYRLQIIADKHVFNFPFLMGQGIWMGSENLSSTDSVREVLKNATLSIGFCGLAETLIALTGKHHGESEESQKLGLEIVQHLRDKTEMYKKNEKMNWSTFSTPAEGTSNSLQQTNRKDYGIIPGVTDKLYMTNSFHVPVYYKIRAIDKIRIEAPYHEKCDAGAISYCEYNGDPTKNIDGFKRLIRAMHDADMGYFSVNHPVDRDPVCGYTGIIENECPHCKRKEHEGWRHMTVSKITI